MKKKKLSLKSIDPRLQFGAAFLFVLLFAVGGYVLLVSPQHAQAAKLKQQTLQQQSQTALREAQYKASLHPANIETADLFELQRAMPDDVDMPGIILALSRVASDAGITFDQIQPVGPSTLGTSTTSQGERIELLFHGDFYSLSDFLYRLRSMVTVRDGSLDANGRLFDVDSVSFSIETFPQITATIYLNAYVYGVPGAPSSSTTTPPTSTDSTSTTPTDTTSTSDSSLPSGASAAGATG